MQVIIPCAGKSSRFPNTRPKYMLTMPDGRMMLQHAADPYIQKGYTVHFVIVKEHVEQYDAEYAIRHAYGDSVFIHILDDFTSGPAETIYEVVKDWNDTPFIVNDCDSFFDYDIPSGPFIVYADIHDYPSINNVAAKSFVIHEDGVVKNIIEKRISSEYICIGAYGFNSSLHYKVYYELLEIRFHKELFLSHIVKRMLEDDVIFHSIQGHNYVDCGTYDSFVENMRNHTTIFCDIDGVIFKNQSHHFKNNYSSEPQPNPNAIQYLKDKLANGATIIFTTSRPEEYKEITENGIRAAGIEKFQVLYGLPHSPRLLINDVSTTNPWPSASAINIPRDDDDYWQMFK